MTDSINISLTPMRKVDIIKGLNIANLGGPTTHPSHRSGFTVYMTHRGHAAASPCWTHLPDE